MNDSKRFDHVLENLWNAYWYLKAWMIFGLYVWALAKWHYLPDETYFVQKLFVCLFTPLGLYFLGDNIRLRKHL